MRVREDQLVEREEREYEKESLTGLIASEKDFKGAVDSDKKYWRYPQ